MIIITRLNMIIEHLMLANYGHHHYIPEPEDHEEKGEIGKYCKRSIHGHFSFSIDI